MWPALLLLIGTGPLFFSAVVKPRTVGDLLPRALTLPVLVPVLCGVVWAFLAGVESETGAVVHRVRAGLLVLSAVSVVTAWVLMLRRAEVWGRWVAIGAAGVVVLAASHVLHDWLLVRGVGDRPGPKVLAMTVQTLYCVVVMLATGVVPILLMCTAQGWTRATGRLWPWAMVVLGVPVILGVAAAGAMVQGSGGLSAAGVLYSTSAGAGLLTLLAAGRASRRQRWVRARRLLLVCWPVSIATAVLGVRLLASGGIPW